MKLEHIILSRLLHDEDYARKVLPFIKSDHFQNSSDRIVYETINDYITKFNTIPTTSAITVELSNRDGLNENQFKECAEIFETVTQIDPSKNDKAWLLERTELWCQDRSLYNALMESIKIANDEGGNLSRGTIPKILTEALAVSFDPNIGHDFIDDAEARHDFYHKTESKTPFDIELLNKITDGGLPGKILMIWSAGTGVGKSLVMCHQAAHMLTMGKNILYITMEMAEERIAERIDANLMDTPISELRSMEKPEYLRKMLRIKGKTTGKIIIKEYPTAGAHVGHFRHLLNELNLKKNFRPDAIFIDYMNICASSRIKAGANVNSYTYVKAISEELRGLAVEFNVPVITATQLNRAGYADSDPGLENTSDSFGIAMTADLILGLIALDELNELNQIMIKQLKNRFSDPGINKKFVVGIDRSRMKIYDVEDSAQENIMDGPMDKKEKSVFDKGDFGGRMEEEESPLWSNKKKLKVSGFK